MAKPVTPATARGERTRQKLLDAAEEEFGEKGFHSASISNITHRAGVAQGTFYIYFSSKEAILRALVEHMSRELRRSQSEAVRGCSDRIEVERTGFRQFLRFALAHKNLYRIVMQSQFVDPDVHQRYYETLLAGYERGIAEAQARGEVRQGDPRALAWALIGMTYFFGKRYATWEGEMPEESAIETVLDFIEAGLRPPSKDGGA
ncbi:HTH-type transcriptional regulator BetI [wastewater metagenome]|uniref:HTH-type transcriptional regulator BetI n=2 Tax=unclassified sequences TaxID=12908 RepID=A0A5B8R9D3_9ZZZZ|nr:TetR/AcrR family transcriptional regulator [Arhodomonas sp. KWT]QEA05161.1 HTH-type transcriptional regulator BetI [uncultured organism]